MHITAVIYSGQFEKGRASALHCGIQILYTMCSVVPICSNSCMQVQTELLLYKEREKPTVFTAQINKQCHGD